MLKTLFGTNGSKKLATDLCAAMDLRARQPLFFADFGVPDTIDGRFDLVVLHAWLVLEGLRQQGLKDISQAFVNVLFVNFDESLRELGVGDIGIGHRVKKMADAFYGRLSAYGSATEQGTLEDALRRNIFRTETGHDADVRALAKYVRSAQSHIARCDLAVALPDFGPLPSVS